MPVSTVVERWVETGEPLAVGGAGVLHHLFCENLLELFYHREALHFLEDGEVIDEAVVDEVRDDIRKIHAWLVYWWREGLNEEMTSPGLSAEILGEFIRVHPDHLDAPGMRRVLSQASRAGLTTGLRMEIERVVRPHGHYGSNSVRAMGMLIFQAALSFTRVEFWGEFLDPYREGDEEDDEDIVMTFESDLVSGWRIDSNGEVERRDGKLVREFRLDPILMPLWTHGGIEYRSLRNFLKLACNTETSDGSWGERDDKVVRLYCGGGEPSWIDAAEPGSLDHDDEVYLVMNITRNLAHRIREGLFG